DDGEVAEAAAFAEELAELAVGERAAVTLDEDPVAGEEPQHSVERVRVGVRLPGELFHRPRSLREAVRDAEHGGHVDRLAEHEAHDPAPQLASERDRVGGHSSSKAIS